MKRSKKHRKRHVLPGPAGLRQQRRTHQYPNVNGINNNSNDNDNDSNGNGNDGDHGTNGTDDDCHHKKRQREHNHDDHDHGEDQEHDPEMIHEHVQIWDAMCLSLDRILPSINSINAHGSNNNRTRTQTQTSNPSSLIRKALSSEYTLLSDLSYLPLLKIPRIAVQIRTIHSHGHCDYTVELTDESVLCQSHSHGHGHGHGRGGHKMAIGWLSQSIIRNHPEWIRPGTVFLCHGVSLAVFKGGDHDGNGNGSVDRMLVLNEENIAYAWTKESIGEVKNDQYLRLLERRADVQERYLAAQEVIEDDLDFEFEDLSEHGGDGDCRNDANDVNAEGGQVQQSQSRLQRDQLTQQSSKEANEDDWSNIPTSSTMDNGAGRVVTNASTSTSQQPNSQQMNVNANANANQRTNARKGDGAGTNLSTRMQNGAVSSSSNRNNSATRTIRQTTIATGPNQRLVNSNSMSMSMPARTSHRETTETVVTTQNGAPSSGAPSASAARGATNPYAKDTTVNNVSVRGGSSVQTSSTCTQGESNSSPSASNSAVRNPYLRTSASQAVQVAPSPVSRQTMTSAVSQEGARSSRNPYLNTSQAMQSQLNHGHNPSSTGTNSTVVHNPYNRRFTSTPTPPNNSSVAVTPSDSVMRQRGDSNRNKDTSTSNTASLLTNTNAVSFSQRSKNPYQKSSHRNLTSDAREENTQIPSHITPNQVQAPTQPSRRTNSITPITQNSSNETTRDSSSNSIWNSVQTSGMDMNAFDEEPERVPLQNDTIGSSEDISIKNTNKNAAAKAFTTCTISMAQNDHSTSTSKTMAASAPPPSVSIFTNLDTLEENEMDAFLEDDDDE